MKACTTSGCGSYAINPHLHGRQSGADLDLCDVCYWRKRATPATSGVNPSDDLEDEGSRMKVYKITLLFLDFDEVGKETAKELIENARLPNHIHPGVVMDMQEADISDWSDEHPLNKQATRAEVFAAIFSATSPRAFVDKSFTRALIRAAKRSMSGQTVDLAEIIAKVADTEPKYITDADISHHLTNALSDLMQLTDAQRSDLYDILHCQSPAQRRHILCKLAFTDVAQLRTLDLWRDGEAG